MAKAITLESLRNDIQQDIRNGIDDVLSVVKDLAQATSDGFERLDSRIDKLDGRMGVVEGSIERLEKHAESVDATLRDHTMRFAQIQLSLDEIIAKQDAHHNDIVEIYAILQKHEKHQKISDTELNDTKLRLQRLVTWAQTTSKTLNIPIKL